MRASLMVALAGSRAALATAVIVGAIGIGISVLRAPPVAAQQATVDAPGVNGVRNAVAVVLEAQAEAWNRGDVDAFVEHYWRSDDLTFSSGGKTTRGWTATRDRYRERYPTRQAMGQLTFDNLEVTPLGDVAAMVLGEWALARDEKPVGGNFTLVMRKVDGRWVIIHDHTSQLAE